MLIKTKGIVLRKTPYTSSSAILKIYTEHFGLGSYLIRGSGKKGKKAAMTQPLSRIEFSTRNKHSDHQVNTLSSPELAEHSVATINPVKSSIKIFLAEFLSKVIREEAPDPDFFEFLDSALEYLDHSSGFQNFHLVFMLKTALFLGIAPELNTLIEEGYFDLESGKFVQDKYGYIHLIEPIRAKVLAELMGQDDFGDDLHISNEERRFALEDILMYYQLHIEGFKTLKSYAVLKEVFS